MSQGDPQERVSLERIRELILELSPEDRLKLQRSESKSIPRKFDMPDMFLFPIVSVAVLLFDLAIRLIAQQVLSWPFRFEVQTMVQIWFATLIGCLCIWWNRKRKKDLMS